MTSSLVSLNATAPVPPLHENALPMPHIFYGIIAICVFLALLAILWSFRNVASKTRPTRPQGKSEH
ncbi:hypothetical protein [Leekyejoonella antrihumi]|uniref:Uncharacterized protein n=1 Tax=Leekyejoonella antrihumi TaxID=1660198 RepID=A0A563DW31_9MICO|nr:hypothetical protein [Leekyejoonella antrihumi]TWP34405.1 hypothetical protein FGL98_17690 [Leekyejoonella antrihumi]